VLRALPLSRARSIFADEFRNIIVGTFQRGQAAPVIGERK
jgi:hypothetical protein